MKQTDWTDTLRKQMERQEEPVGDELWAGIEQALDAQSAATATRRLALRRWIAAAAVLIAAVGGGIFWLSRQTDVPAEQLPTEQKLLNRRNTIRQSIGIEPAETRPLVAQNKATEQENVIPLPLHSITDDGADVPYCAEPSAPPFDDSAEEAPRQPQPASPSQPLPQPLNPTTEPVVRHQATSGVSLRLYAGNGLVAYQRQDGVVMSSEMQRQYHMNKRNSPTMSRAATNDATVYLVGYGEEAHHDLPISVGLTADVPLTASWSLTTGVVYTQLNATLTRHMREHIITTRQQLHYVGVPLTINYRLLHGRRFAVYAMGGGQIDFNVKGDYRTEGTRQPMKKDQPQCSLTAGVGAILKLTPVVGLYAEPSMRYSFDNGSSVKTFFKEKPFSPALQLGIRMQMK